IQSLYQRYLNESQNPESSISPLYYSVGRISFVLEITPEGELANVVDLREVNGKKLVTTKVIVPEQPGRANGIKPFFLSDKAEYILGHYTLSDNESEQAKKIADARSKFAGSKTLHEAILASSPDTTSLAILAFFAKWKLDEIRSHPQLQAILVDLDKGLDTNLLFRVLGERGFAHEQETIKTIWRQYREQEQPDMSSSSQCLVSGHFGEPIAQTHDIKIKGVRNSQAAGAALVSFNAQSFESYGKSQSFNAPVSKTAAFGYATALNHLLASERNRIVNFGGMTVVFWADPSPASAAMEEFFEEFFGPSQANDAEQASLTANIRDAMLRVRDGAAVTADMLPDANKGFTILGLSPNNARLAVRFFWQGEFGNLLMTMGQHAADFNIVGQGERFADTPKTFRILLETLRVGSDGKKVGSVPDALEGEMFRSIVNGTAYPPYLYTHIINRIRTDGMINRLRAAIVKAYLIRYGRIQNIPRFEEVLSVSLNKETTDPGYRLGRLFAVLERAQQDAAGGPNRLNATIKDRFFSSASATPAAVFPNLIRLASTHTSKSKYGGFREREMGEILDVFDPENGGFPVQLSIQEQGLFFIGYYQQKEEFFSHIKSNEAPIQIQVEMEMEIEA
ncbi:MAG: type I-C CRISPR-associated protein Cas8c/Csd1, partial [Gorillibacterium sp.]|nr:type I-C CRISPR-associated protein Cas8c/Csd1 [Gorillibacterium sp.]